MQSWAKLWIKEHQLPQLMKGCHEKVYSVLNDPVIHAYVQSNKWAMNSMKLKEFSDGKLVPEVAEKYLQGIVNDEMPKGLKKYLELEPFPHIQLKVKKGISLSMAC